MTESWQNLTPGLQVALTSMAIMLVIGVAVSIVLRAAAAPGTLRRTDVQQLVRSGRIAVPGLSRTIPMSVVAGFLVIVGWTGVTMTGVGLMTSFADPPARQLTSLQPATTELTFGGVVTGTTASAQLVLTNTAGPGGDAIMIEQLTVSGADAASFAVVSAPGAEVEAGSATTITVEFTPSALGRQTADLQVVHSGENSPSFVRLDGRGARAVRINAGGPEITDSPAWTDDEEFLDSENTFVVEDAPIITGTHPSIPVGTPTDLFRTARVSDTSSLNYAFPTGPGTYELRLYFAEDPEVDAPLLDVTVNDEAVVRLLDVGEEAGRGRGMMVPILVQSTTDILEVRIHSLVGSPWVNAIELVDVSQSDGPQFAAPDDIDVGPAHVESTVAAEVIMGNAGDRLVDPTVLFSAPEAGSTEFSIGRIETTAIGHGNEITAPITFTPSSTGPREGVLEVEHNGAGSSHTIRAAGIGWQAGDDVAETLEEAAVVIPVLANDADGRDFLSVSDVSPPPNGVATTDGTSITYQPGLNFTGADTFTYRVIDTNGTSGEASITVTVTDVNDPPRANANGPYLGAVGAPVSFSSAGSSDLEGALRYEWTFGDGSSSTASNPSHTYGEPGTYTVVLTVTDVDGVSATSSTTARIESGLVIQIAGSGSGSVTSTPAGISCPSDCSETYSAGTPVTLSATPAQGSTFIGWSGACSGTGPCSLTMSGPRLITANFAINRQLTVAVNGSGSVTSSPTGIACPGDCTQAYTDGAPVTLTAAAQPGWTFTGWSGACTGTGPCVVSMTTARSVGATFIQTHQLSVAVTGSGSVGISPPGITCSTTCTQTYNDGSTVTLTATANPGWTFTSWTGAACTGISCQVTMTQAHNVTATFTQDSHQLSVTVSPPGSGRVTSAPPGINCTTSCFSNFTQGTTVVLTANAQAGWTFTGWSGAACTGTSCQVTMTQARSVTASFTRLFRLTVGVGGPGTGTVTTSPGRITCSGPPQTGDCGESFIEGTVVTLSATPDPGSTFAFWSGNCSGPGPCLVTMDRNLNVTANFALVPVPPPGGVP